MQLDKDSMSLNDWYDLAQKLQGRLSGSQRIMHRQNLWRLEEYGSKTEPIYAVNRPTKRRFKSVSIPGGYVLAKRRRLDSLGMTYVVEYGPTDSLDEIVDYVNARKRD